MDGWIIQNRKGQYLTKGLGWMSSEPENSFVFSDAQVKNIKSVSTRWKIKPATITQARYDGSKVVVTGSPREFWEDE